VKLRALVPRERAVKDIEDAVAWYLSEGGPAAALGFIDAIEQAWRLIGRLPAAGSPRLAQELNLPGLRTWPLKRYPWIVCYVERPGHIDVWRLLAAQRDVPAWLEDPGPR